MDRCVSTLWLRRHDWMREIALDNNLWRQVGQVYDECDRCGTRRDLGRGELWLGRARTDVEIAFEDGLDKWLLGINPSDVPLLGLLKATEGSEMLGKRDDLVIIDDVVTGEGDTRT